MPTQRPRKRFWVYKHDSDGDLTLDLGEFDTLEAAIDAAIDIGLSEEGYDQTVRVVDNDLMGGTTVWWAGPKALEVQS